MSGAHEPITIDHVIKAYARQEWGFTGTRSGMSVAQHGWCKRLLTQGKPSVFRHGGAYGADTQVHAIHRDQRVPGRVIVYPADAKRHALFINQQNVQVNDIREPLTRNLDIVGSSAFIIGTPHTQHEIIRSGTWHTIRAALRAEKPTLVLWPNGQMTLHRDGILYRVV
jgi:hypothetical protein